MRLILGARYAEEVKIYRQALRGKTKESGKSLAVTALELCKELERAGYSPRMMMAAFVEESERPEEEL
jgi:hypothetical protein